MSSYRLITLDSLWNKIISLRHITDEGHWLYLGCTDSLGYGKIKFQNKSYLVHRISAIVNLGIDSQDNVSVCHKNTCHTSGCFNPDHLYIGNQQSNVLDTISFGNHNASMKTHCLKGHEFSSINTYVHNGKRQCLECKHQRYLRSRT